MTGRAGLGVTIPGGVIDTAQTVAANRSARAGALRNEATGRLSLVDQTIRGVPQERAIVHVARQTVDLAQTGPALSVENDPLQSRNLFFPTSMQISSQKCWTGWRGESSPR